MTRRLPPLNSLRAFEAAARHRSISEAARELLVTHSAVGRHVAKLEEYLGTRLFVRDNNRLTLTPQGEAYAARIAASLDQIQEATAESFNQAGGERTLRIGTYPTFASQVLIPRLARFRDQHPDIPFQIETSHVPFDPTAGEIDVAVWLGTGNWPNLITEHLFAEEWLPVGSPKLLRDWRPRETETLDQFTLLHSLQQLDAWEHWFKAAGVKNVDAHRGLRFEHTDMVYQAAANQLGIAMAQAQHVRDDLDNGRLVRLLEFTLKTQRSYFLVYAPSKSGNAKVGTFARWMKAEAAMLSTPLPPPYR